MNHLFLKQTFSFGALQQNLLCYKPVVGCKPAAITWAISVETDSFEKRFHLDFYNSF
jgi:hypothetical protein